MFRSVKSNPALSTAALLVLTACVAGSGDALGETTVIEYNSAVVQEAGHYGYGKTASADEIAPRATLLKCHDVLYNVAFRSAKVALLSRSERRLDVLAYCLADSSATALVYALTIFSYPAGTVPPVVSD